MPAQSQRRARREDWRQRAKEMRSDFRDEFSNANRTQYYVGDPQPTDISAPGGHGQSAQLARKLAARGDMRNQQLYDLVQQRQDLFRPGTDPNEKLGGPLGPEPTLTGAMPAPPPETPPGETPPVSSSMYGLAQAQSGPYTPPRLGPNDFARPRRRRPRR